MGFKFVVDLPQKLILLKCGLLNVEEREREFFLFGCERGREQRRERVCA